MDRFSRKHGEILEAATEVFLGNGYLGTSMDEIAARAGVSKQTVYKHFADKEALFSEIVETTLRKASDPVHEDVRRLGDRGDVEADLRELAHSQLAAALRPEVIQLRRLVIGEVSRFPEHARSFYEEGQGRMIGTLAGLFERLAERGMLELDDPLLAARQFNWLIMSAPVNQAMLLPNDLAPSRAEMKRHVASGVRVFLAAYGGG